MPALPQKLKRTVVMVGMMGAGKTAVGSALARDLEVPFVDSDREIEQAANATVAEIFERDGETFFREKETQILARLLQGEPSVLSTGGGAFMSEDNRKLISDAGISVCLDVEEEVLWNRVRHKTTRPLLQKPDPRAELSRLCALRRPIYALADVVVRAKPGYSIADTAAAVRRALNEADVLEAAQ